MENKPELDPRELRVDTYTNNSPGGEMRITHLPSGLQVYGSGQSLYKLREGLMADLANLVTGRVKAWSYADPDKPA